MSRHTLFTCKSELEAYSQERCTITQQDYDIANVRIVSVVPGSSIVLHLQKPLTIKPNNMTTTFFVTKKRNPSRAMLVLAALITSLLFSCSKDKDDNSPAYYISESEMLIMPAAVELPSNPPNGNARVATYYATGVQKYKAQAVPGSSPVIYQWVFVAPKADLYDGTNRKVGTHGAGPSWQVAGTIAGQPSDSIFGQQFTPAKTATGGEGNVDWLQLMPKAGTTPTGIFSDVIYIQRIATKGGKAPANAPASADVTIDVPYTAVYRFSRKNQ